MNLLQYDNEIDGQIAFWQEIIPFVNNNLTVDEILVHNTDGILNGNIVECKLVITDISATLFQALKYCSSLQQQGIPVPANIELISLNESKCYVYHSEDFLDYIEQVYVGAASKNNDKDFIDKNGPCEILNLSNSLDVQRLIELMREDNYTKVHISINNILGWHKTFYSYKPQATKGEFLGEEVNGMLSTLGEIRKPTILSEFIYPYKELTNIEFKLVMDVLNARFQKKDLGAFYTPLPYVELVTNTLLKEAIARVPKGNDYVIIDNCAGSGNLLQFCDDEILSHYIVSTYEFYEYLCLRAEFGTRVRHVIPPFKKVAINGIIPEANALSEQYINNPIIKQYIDNPNCTIILNINPPYTESTSIEHQKANKGKKSSEWKNNWVVRDATNPKHVDRLKGASSNDMANVFIWSAIHHYMRQDADSLIVYAPIKYWKNNTWMNKEFIDGYIFNRHHFHTNSDVAITCVLWSNEECEQDSITLKCRNIKNGQVVKDNYDSLEVKRVFSQFSEKYYDKRSFKDDIVAKKGDVSGVWCQTNGQEAINKNIRVNSVDNNNIMGYLTAKSNITENPALKTYLLRKTAYDGNGFQLRKDNFVEKLPMFAAGWWYTYNPKWELRGTIYRTGDGCDKYELAVKQGKLDQWLKKVVFYTCMEHYNKCRSFIASNGQTYMNELCLDNLGDYTTEASKAIADMNMNDRELEILDVYHRILAEAKKTKNYNPSFTYGIFQIEEELNTSHKEKKPGRKTEQIVYDYPILNSRLKDMRRMVKEYYQEEIQNTLFEYEFLK